MGAVGPKGNSGATGPAGAIGPAGHAGATGPAGATGQNGATGVTGATGSIGPLAFAEFFALMPPDNATTVAVGGTVNFPQDGPTSGADIARTSASTFNLAAIGVYHVTFQVPVTEAGQLILTLDGADLAYTVVGRQTGATQITGDALVQTTTIDSVVAVANPSGNLGALTITPIAGGARPASASLIIERID